MDYKGEQHVAEVNTNSTHQRKRGGILNTLYPPGPKPGAKGRVKNHCRKFWWCDLLVLAVLVLVIVLPLIYAAVPKIAQDQINGSTLEVTAQDVTGPRPDSIHLKLESTIKSDSKYHPTLDRFDASLSLEDKKPFLNIVIPTTKSKEEVFVTVDQDIKITDMAAFTEYAMVALASETFDVYLDGKPTIHLSGLPAMNVDYNKKISMKGLNALKGLNITDFEILLDLDKVLADGSNAKGTVFIPNPSVMTLDLGNVTMNLAVGDESLGFSLLPNLILKPGDNYIPMQATTDQAKVITLITSKYKNAVLPLDITGNSSMVGDQHLSYFETALQHSKIRVDLNVGPALAAVGLNLTGS
ncbi:hypothetical protein P153DRAFT_283411 [Dothidotthia symphoricarpi CBS 119687]|uniref:DUF3712 domain-containing protein n=1 Tax=Dothidotthia symphoricarpi CBS 119687 TaxID=1392245 RepID=A0A6A6ANQ6_9PLEO|nr:uncharacterized protein P153DRAFT_283411 [Dothidotthia symphoricarpi CBS 119687]KAF2132527.1 hypothetical protein P153DRAFT_283411 [Dothidotthia symphoricarpi CBS 119687]